MKRKNKTKKIELPMEYNPGYHKFEPVLPLKKSSKEVKFEVDWKWLIFPIIILAILITLIYLLLK